MASRQKPARAEHQKPKDITMKTTLSAATCALLLGLGVQARANADYNFTFSGDGVTATGSFDVSGGVASTGSINVTGAALDGTFGLVQPSPLGSVRGLDGTDIIFDNLYFPTGNPSLDGNGLGFAGGYRGPYQYDYVVNIWGNGPGNYSLFEAGELPGDPTPVGHVYNEYDGGSFTVTPVPDGGATAAMLGAGLLCLALARRRATA
jgi:hypothetical protein